MIMMMMPLPLPLLLLLSSEKSSLLGGARVGAHSVPAREAVLDRGLRTGVRFAHAASREFARKPTPPDDSASKFAHGFENARYLSRRFPRLCVRFVKHDPSSTETRGPRLDIVCATHVSLGTEDPTARPTNSSE